MNETGYFIFSLDTELGTGYFDRDADRKKIFSADGSREREQIARVLEILDQYQIIATWAVVGHIFYERCEECEICPILEWKGKYKSFEEAYKTRHPLWYGADVIDKLLAAKIPHEIAFHGYTHETFDSMSREKAEVEIKEFKRLASRKGIDAKSIVFPRNMVAHLDLFEEHGFICYRGNEPLTLLTRNRNIICRMVKNLDQILGISTPPVYEPEDFVAGSMVNLSASQHIYGFSHNIERLLDALGLPNLRLRRIRRAIRKAAAQKKVVHIWAHPWEFRTKADVGKLKYILESVAEEVAAGRMKSISMVDMAKMVKQTYG